MAVEGDSLTLSWLKDGKRQWRCERLPADLCRDGLPMQRQALGELCADLLLDSGLSTPGVDLELLLPLQACQWRLLEGDAELTVLDGEALRQLQPRLDWPFSLENAYLALHASVGTPTMCVLVGTQRLMLQAWVDVVEAADLRLHRVDWLLASAWSGLVGSFDQVPDELIWLIRSRGGWRVLLLRHGFPELDRWLGDVELSPDLAKAEALQAELKAMLLAWDRDHRPAQAQPQWERTWWITALPQDREQWLPWLGAMAEGPVLGFPQGATAGLVSTENPLMTLALEGGDRLDLLAERRPELGLSPAAPPVRESRNLLLQGAAWGGGVLLLTLVGLGVMRWWETYQRQQLEALLPVEQTVLATEAKLRRLKLRTASLEKDNRQIAQQLVAVRSGSALLEQLRRITPQGVQLQDLSVNGDAISVSGVVQAGGRPGPLERINSLVLAMAALPASKEEGVKVVKITRTDKGDGSVVSFSLTWGLDLSVQPTLAEFEALGAKGMAERLRLLELEGVTL